MDYLVVALIFLIFILVIRLPDKIERYVHIKQQTKSQGLPPRPRGRRRKH